MSGTIQKNTVLDGKYKILLFIKKGVNAETYRVKGNDGMLYFLKLFNVAQVHYSAFDEDGNLLEIEFLKQANHPNIVTYKDSGEIVVGGRKYFYLVLDFISGETVAERIAREPVSMLYDIKQIATGVLEGLNYLHSLPEPVIHNEITPQNIMLDLSVDIPVAKIIDFGNARSFYRSAKSFNKTGLDLNYLASECITAGVFSPHSDLFSAGAVIYRLLLGMPPWFRDTSKFQAERTKAENLVLEAREKPLAFPNISNRIVDFDDSILAILTKALQPDSEQRFQSAREFIQALNGDFTIETSLKKAKQRENAVTVDIKPKKGKGFAAIAGMQQLKAQMKTDVIDVIENPEEYRRHNLGLPNGMLLYGPPGCGKTFFAERFAEEAGYNFIKIISSDIASIYIHGTQEKIGKIFKEAREKAPTILYFDELDAMIPNRENLNNQSQSGEVNEFLSQMDNIGDSGVFVIGSTNQPNLIDKAVLRAGRLEKWFYIPPPDFEARKTLFELYLKDRPLDFGIDYARLATLTENYVSSDIKLLVDEASRKTIREKAKRITMEMLESVIKDQKPTILLAELNKYEAIRKEMEGEQTKQERRKIGF
jgi:transitional endoplasmic reticulum ATPase